MNTPNTTLIVNRRIHIPYAEFTFETTRSSGPGGQNVNKVSSKVRLRWPVETSTALPDDLRERIIDRLGNRITNEGELIITSQRHRDQHRNREDCIERLRVMILDAARVPIPRRPTRPTKGSQQRRLTQKRQQSQKKRLRNRPSRED